MKTRVLIIIGSLVFATFVALIFGAAATSYIYNKAWLANGNDIPECLKSAATVRNCAQIDGEYLDGLDLWSNVTSFSILITSIVLGVKLYKKKIAVRNN